MASIPIGHQSPLHAGERRQRSTSRSRLRSPSSPHGIVTDGSEALEDEKEEEGKVEHDRETLQEGGNGEASSPIESSARFLSHPTDGVSGDDSATGTSRPSSNVVYSLPTCSPLPSSERCDSKGHQQVVHEAALSKASSSVEAAVRLVSPGRSEIIPDVSIQSGGTVRWTHGGGAGTVTGVAEAVAGSVAVHQGENLESVSGGEKGDGVGRCVHGGGGNRVKEEGMTVLIMSDVLDEPMTRRIPLSGSCADLVFDRPGSYAYFVFSGPVTQGRVLVEETHTSDPVTTRAGDCITAASPSDSSASPVREGEALDVMSEQTAPAEEMAESDVSPASAVATAPKNRVAPSPSPLPSPLSTPEVASPVEEGRTSTGGTLVQQPGPREAHLNSGEALSHSCETSTKNATRTKEILPGSDSPPARSQSVGGCSSHAVQLAGGSDTSPVSLLPTAAVNKDSCLPGRSSREQEKGTTVEGAAGSHDRSEEIDNERLSCEDSTLTLSDSETRAPEYDGCGEPSEADVIHGDGEGRTVGVKAARPGSEATEDERTMGAADKEEACEDDSVTVDLDSDGDLPSDRLSVQISHSSSSFERDDHNDHDDHDGEQVVADITNGTNVEEIVEDLAPQLSEAKGVTSFCADGAGEYDERKREAETRSESVIAKIDSLSASPLRGCSSRDPEPEARPLDGPSEECTPFACVKERPERGRSGPQGSTSDLPDEDVVSPPEGVNVGGDPVVQQAPKLERTEEAIPGDDSGHASLPSSPSLTLPPMLRPDHSRTLHGQEGSGGTGATVGGEDLPSSFDSDDVPSGGWIGVDSGIAAAALAKAAIGSPKESLKQSPRRSLMSTRGGSSSSIPVTLAIVGVVDSGDEAPLSSQMSEISSSSPKVAPTATAAAQPCISISSKRLGSRRQRVEVLQRDGSGQEWQEVSPLTSPATRGSGTDDIGSFSCSEIKAALPNMSGSGDGGDDNVRKAEHPKAASLAVKASVENAVERGQTTAAVVVKECSEMLATVKHSVAHIDETSGGTAHAAGDTISRHSESVTSAKSPKSSSTSCPSGAAAAAATAAGLAAAAGAAGCDDMPAVLARHEASRESGGTAPASPAEEDPRCRAWSAEGDACVDLDGAAERDSTPNGSPLLCSSVAETLHRKQSPPLLGTEGVPSSSGLKAVDAIVTIMEDEARAGVSLFEPEILTAPVGTRVRWERRVGREKDCDDAIRPATFKGRVSTMSGNGDNSGSDWKVAFSFSLSAEQPSFVYTFSREGRYEIANEVGDMANLDGAPASARGVVCIERVAGASDSDSFASGDENGSGSGSGNRTSTSIDDDTHEGHDDEYSKDSDSSAPPSPIPNLVSTQQHDCIIGDDMLSSDGGGLGSGGKHLFDVHNLVSSVPPPLLRTAGSSGGIVYSSSGVGTHDSIVSAPPPPPSVAAVSSTATTVSRYAVGCAGTGSAHTPVLQRHRSLPPISTLLGSEELVDDDGDCGGRAELRGRSGWSLQADRLKVLGTRKPVIDKVVTAEATTASLSHVTVLDDAKMSRGRASPSRSSSGTDEYSASSLSDGQQEESPRPRDCGRDDDIDTDGSSTEEDITIAVDRSIMDNDILSVCDDGTASSSGENLSCATQKETDHGVQSRQSIPDNTHSAAAAIVSSRSNPAINPRLGDNGGSDGLLSVRVGTKPASSLTVAVETAVPSGDGSGDTAAAVAPALSSPGGDSECRDDFEGVASTTAAATARKKKKRKKSKKKSKAAEGEQREEEGRTAEEGRRGGRVGWADCRRQLWGERSALLLEERTYFKAMTRRVECEVMSGGDGRVDNYPKDFAKVAKTLISRDDGFKPAKPMTVEVEAIVAIKKSKLSKERYSYRPRTITLAGPVDGNHAASLLLLDETNNFEDVPFETTSLEAWPAGRDLEVIFFDPGDYYLVDHGAEKRVKITAVERATSPPPPLPPTESITSRGTDVGRPVTAEASGTSSRSRKKKGKGKKAGGARTMVADAAGTASTGRAGEVGDASRFVESCPSPSVERSSSDEGADSGEEGEKPRIDDDKGEEEEHAVISVDGRGGCDQEAKVSSRQESFQEQPRPLPHSLPLVVASREGQRLSASERQQFEQAGAVGQVVVSHKKGFEPTVLHVGFASGRGALVVCELGPRECVTREVVCRHSSEMLLPREPDSTDLEARTVGGVLPVGLAGTPGDGDEDGPGAFVSARLGPGPLRICHFILGRAGRYYLAYRDDVAREPTVVFVQSTADLSRCDMSVRDECEPTKPTVPLRSERVGHADEESTVGGRSPEQKHNDESSEETVATVGVDAANDECTNSRLRDEDCRAEKDSSVDRFGGVGSPSDSSEVAGKDSSCNSRSPTVRPDATSSTMRPPQRSAIGVAGMSSTFTRGSTWCEKGFMGESGSWSGDGGGSFVQQRSHVKKSRRQQRSRAKKIKGADPENVKAAAQAAEVEEEAAAIEVVRVHITEEERAAAALASTKASPGESLRSTGPTTTNGNVPTATCEAKARAVSGLAPVPKESKAVTSTENVVAGAQSLVEASKTRTKVAGTVNIEPATDPQAISRSGTATASPLQGVASSMKNERMFSGQSPTSREHFATKRINTPKQHRKNSRHGSSWCSSSASKESSYPETQTEPYTARGIVENTRERGTRQNWKLTSTKTASAAPDTRASSWAASAPPEVKAATDASGWDVPATGASWTEEPNTATITTVDAVDVLQQQDSGKYWGASGGSARARPNRRHQISRQDARAPSAPAGQGVPPVAMIPRWPLTPPLAPFPSPKDLPTLSGRGDSTDGELAAVGVAPTGDGQEPVRPPRSVVEGGWGTVRDAGVAAAGTGASPSAEVSSAATGVVTAAGSDDDGLPRPHTHPARGRSMLDSGSSGTRATCGKNNEQKITQVIAAGDREEVGTESVGKEQEPVAADAMLPASSRSDDEAVHVSFSFGDFASHAVEPVAGSAIEHPLPCQQQQEQRHGRTSPCLHPSEDTPASRSMPASTCSAVAGNMASVVDDMDEVKHAGGECSNSPSVSPGYHNGDDGSVEMQATDTGVQSSDGSDGDGGGGGGDGWDRPQEGTNAVPRVEAEGGWATNNASPPTATASGNGDGRNDSEADFTASLSSPPTITTTSTIVPTAANRTANDDTQHAVGAAAQSASSSDPAGTTADPATATTSASHLGGTKSEGDSLRHPAVHQNSISTTTTAATAPPPPPLDNNGVPMTTGQPRWGNCSSKVSGEERARRSQELEDHIRRRPHGSSSSRAKSRGSRGGGCHNLKPAEFPESSRLPAGGYWVAENEDDRLPPPSEFEIVEAARMMKLYDDMMRRLENDGVDKMLPNGHTPAIYDLTEGSGDGSEW